MGDLSSQRIRKKPREAYIREVEPVKQSEELIHQVQKFFFTPYYFLYFQGFNAFALF